MSTTAIQRKQLNEAAHVIHYHISERCIRMKIKAPLVREVRDKIIIALFKIEKYKNMHTVDSTNRDMIKYFSFSIPFLINEWDTTTKHKIGNGISGEVFYLSFFDYLASTYRQVDFKKHPDIKNTCRILKEMATSDKDVSTYTYFKGISEACICVK